MNQETEAQQKGGVKLLLVLHSYGNTLGESRVSSQDFWIFFFLLSVGFNILKTRSGNLSHKVSQTQDWNPVATKLMGR